LEVIEKVISYKWKDSFTVYPIGDIHYGSIHCDEDGIEKQTFYRDHVLRVLRCCIGIGLIVLGLVEL